MTVQFIMKGDEVGRNELLFDMDVQVSAKDSVNDVKREGHQLF